MSDAAPAEPGPASRSAPAALGPRQQAWLALPPPHPELAARAAPARVGRVRLGTAGWADETLLGSGAFYPPPVKTPELRLRYYARHFPVAEADTGYYAIPSVRTTQAWAARTPDDFRFGVKAYAPLTGHPFEPSRLPAELREALPATVREAKLARAEDLEPAMLDALHARFRAALAPLHAAGKLDYVLLQFPKWFAPTVGNARRLAESVARLEGLPAAVELRRPDWFEPARVPRLLGLLSELGASYVCVDGPQGTAASVPPLVAVTQPRLAVVRFHGRNVADWDRRGAGVSRRFRYRYETRELSEWVARLRRLADEAEAVDVLMNNCFEHYAAQNAKELADLLLEAARR